jgi:2-desacetyl-2-hydroxyethyl bacteriochlorophyllide A dehydrogenase
MKAAVFAGEGRVEIRDEPRPSLASERDVIVRVEVCGICGSDIRALSVPPLMDFNHGVIMGHEFVGDVVEAGAAMQHLLGERVVAVPNLHCGRCFYCRSDQPHHCDNFQHLGATTNGAFAEFCGLPGDLTRPVPRTLSSDVAALSEPLACVLNATARAGWSPGSAVVIQGAGPIGLLFGIVARLAGAAPLIISEPSAARRAEALRIGADVVVDPSSDDLPELVRSVTDGLGAEVVIDAVGTLLDQALRCLRKGGKVMIFGLDERARTTISPSLVANRELAIEGSYITRGTFPLALELLSAHPDQFGALITGRFALEEVADGVAAMREGRVVKALVYPDGVPATDVTSADEARVAELSQSSTS